MTPAPVVQADSADLTAGVNALLRLNPAAVAVWGEAETAANLLQALHDVAWPGIYFYRSAAEAEFRARLNSGVANGVLGVTNWIPGLRSAASDRFLRTYAFVDAGH
jgi:hypothetical protein